MALAVRPEFHGQDWDRSHQIDSIGRGNSGSVDGGRHRLFQLLLVCRQLPVQIADHAAKHADQNEREDDQDDDDVGSREVHGDGTGQALAGLLVPAELEVSDRVAHEIRMNASGIVAVVLSLEFLGKR